MNILLAFKAEPDLSMLVDSDWQAATRSITGPDPALMRFAMGSDEQGAAELMLQARDAESSLKLSAVTLGHDRALPALRHLAALGFSELTLIESASDSRFNPAWVAQQLAAKVRESVARAVLVGTQSSEGQSGQTGWLLAEMLGWPCLSQVCEVRPQGEGLLVECENLTRRSQWQIEQPVVLMVRNRGQMALRVPGMKARLAAAKAEIKRQPSTNAEHEPVTCLALARQSHRRAGEIISEPTDRAAARRLWETWLAERMTS